MKAFILCYAQLFWCIITLLLLFLYIYHRLRMQVAQEQQNLMQLYARYVTEPNTVFVLYYV